MTPQPSQTRQHRKTRDWIIQPSPDKQPGHWEQVRGGGFVRVGERG